MIFAKRDIMPGEQVFICYYDLNNKTPPAGRRSKLEFQHGFVCQCEQCIADEESPTCDNCKKTTAESGVEKLRKCTRCWGYRYCGRECQTKHWPKHKAYCNQMYKISKDQGLLDETNKKKKKQSKNA